MKDFLMDLAIVVVVLVIALPFAIKSCEPNEVVKCDTIYVHDTIRIVEPIHIKETIVRHDTVFFPIYNELESTSNLTSNLTQDSAKVVIPITERTYEDSTYKAVVRGYNPELVSLDIYNTTKYYPVVEKVKIKPKVVISAGLYGGFGSKGADYGLGIMVGMPIWSW
jgi:hypothetical protein